MDFRHLRYFVAVAEQRSFSRAAEVLVVAQPGLSSQVRRLEAELGVVLFERHTRGAELTEAGRLFLGRARAVLRAADLPVSGTAAAPRASPLRLGVSNDTRWTPTAWMLRRLSDDAPDVAVAVVEGDGGALWRDLRADRLDAVVGPAELISPDLQGLPLGARPWTAVMGPRHRLAGAGPLTLTALEGQRVLVAGRRDALSYDRAVARLLADAGVSVETVRMPAGTTPVLAAAASSDAVALTTEPSLLPEAAVLRPLTPSRELGFAVLWREEAMVPALNRLLAHLGGRGEPRLRLGPPEVVDPTPARAA